jgi:hypothetical protein
VQLLDQNESRQITSQLPLITESTAQHGLTVATVRRAIDVLVKEGLVQTAPTRAVRDAQTHRLCDAPAAVHMSSEDLIWVSDGQWPSNTAEVATPLVKARSGPCSGPEWKREPQDLASPAWLPSQAGSGYGLEYCLLVCAAVGFVTGAPGAPHLVAEPLWHLVPVAAAHQPGRIDLITAARCRATACG